MFSDADGRSTETYQRSLSGRLFKMVGPATGKARRPTVNSRRHQQTIGDWPQLAWNWKSMSKSRVRVGVSKDGNVVGLTSIRNCGQFASELLMKLMNTGTVSERRCVQLAWSRGSWRTRAACCRGSEGWPRSSATTSSTCRLMEAGRRGTTRPSMCRCSAGSPACECSAVDSLVHNYHVPSSLPAQLPLKARLHFVVGSTTATQPVVQYRREVLTIHIINK